MTTTRIAGVVTAATALVRTANDACVDPAANNSDGLAGTAADGFVLVIVAATPPEGAGHSIVAAPVTLAPPVTAVGVNVTAVR